MATYLSTPVMITVIVEESDGTTRRMLLEPGKSLTDDGVSMDTNVDRREFRHGLIATFTRHTIEWTEVEYETTRRQP